MFSSGLLLVAERQVGLNAIHVGLVNHGGLCHMTFLLGIFTRQKMSPGGVVANNLARSGDLETFGHRLARFAACY